jgi:hypothetical protein
MKMKYRLPRVAPNVGEEAITPSNPELRSEASNERHHGIARTAGVNPRIEIIVMVARNDEHVGFRYRIQVVKRNEIIVFDPDLGLLKSLGDVAEQAVHIAQQLPKRYDGANPECGI